MATPQSPELHTPWGGPLDVDDAIDSPMVGADVGAAEGEEKDENDDEENPRSVASVGAPVVSASDDRDGDGVKNIPRSIAPAAVGAAVSARSGDGEPPSCWSSWRCLLWWWRLMLLLLWGRWCFLLM